MFQRFLFYISYLFFATSAFVAIRIAYCSSYVIEKTAIIGVLIIYLGLYYIFYTKLNSEYFKKNCSLISHYCGAIGLFIVVIIVNPFNLNPLTNYLTARTIDDTGYVLSDEVYKYKSSIPKGSYIERYNYSPRTARLYDATLSYELYRDSNPIKFGILVTCEAFAFYAIILSPLFFWIVYYEEKKGNPPPNFTDKDLMIYAILLFPFAIGLSPLLN